jgi:hypothetical protein
MLAIELVTSRRYPSKTQRAIYKKAGIIVEEPSRGKGCTKIRALVVACNQTCWFREREEDRRASREEQEQKE